MGGLPYKITKLPRQPRGQIAIGRALGLGSVGEIFQGESSVLNQARNRAHA